MREKVTFCDYKAKINVIKMEMEQSEIIDAFRHNKSLKDEQKMNPTTNEKFP
jgi:hypothetical protein